MTPFERALVGELEGSHGDRVHVGDVHGATALHHYAGLNSAISIPPASHPFLGTSMGPNGRSGARRARSAAGHLPPRPTRGRSAPASAGRSRMLGGHGPARLADPGRLAKRSEERRGGAEGSGGAWGWRCESR